MSPQGLSYYLQLCFSDKDLDFYCQLFADIFWRSGSTALRNHSCYAESSVSNFIGNNILGL